MAAVLLIFAVCLLSLSSAEGQGMQIQTTVTGSDLFVTDDTRELNVTCQTDYTSSFSYGWILPGDRTCPSPAANTCTFRPQTENDGGNVTCVILAVQGGTLVSLSQASLTLNLQYPPAEEPVISKTSPPSEALKQGDTVTCQVSGGKPRVTSVTFYCQNPVHADQTDDFIDDGRTVSSAITVNTSQATYVYINCTCSATWNPEPGLYSKLATKSFLLETSPRIMDSSYDSSDLPLLEATGHTFFIVAYPVPDTTKFYFHGTNKEKEPVLDNTFKTEFTRNTTMTHLVNCRVTPRNVPENQLGRYEMSISNGLGEVSLFFNVTSSAIRHKENSNGTSIGKTIAIIVGTIVGIVLLVGIIVVIRWKRNAASNNDNHNNEPKPPDTIIIPPTPASQDSQPDMIAANAGDKIKDGQSSTCIEFEAGYTTADQVGKTDCRSTDYNGYAVVGGATSTREQAVYNHLNGNTAPPVDSSTYSHAETHGAQPEGSVDSATHNSIAPCSDKPPDTTIGPKGDVYATVPPKQKGGNPPQTDET